MNILVVAFHQVYPLETGASVAQVGIIDYLSNQCNLNVSLLLPEENSALTDQELFEIGQILPKVKIYQLDNRYTPKNKLVKRLVNFARVYKHKIKLILTKDPRSNQQEPSQDEEFIGMYSFWDPFYIHHEKYVEILKQIIWQDKIDIVQLEYVENLNLVTVLPAHVKTVFVEHECIFYRIQSHIKAKQIKSVIAEYVFQFYRTVEAALLEKVDGVVTFNKFENLLLNDALKNKNHQVKFLVSPFPVLERDFRKINREEFSRPSKLIFVGGEHHFPNKDAVEWFIEKIAVEVFNKFGLRLFVVGKWKPDTIKNIDCI